MPFQDTQVNEFKKYIVCKLCLAALILTIPVCRLTYGLKTSTFIVTEMFIFKMALVTKDIPSCYTNQIQS